MHLGSLQTVIVEGQMCNKRRNLVKLVCYSGMILTKSYKKLKYFRVKIKN